MANDLLYAFIQVIDSGSFSKAAEKLYISSTALMKQMNALEAQIGAQLLIRTNHGIQATDAGNSFYYDAKFLVQYLEKATVRARQAANTNPYTIRIGTSMFYPCNVLLNLWNTFSDTHPQFKMKIVPFDTNSESWPTDYRTLGKDFDVMVGAYDRANGSGSFDDLKLGDYRFCIAVSREHSLAKKEMLSVTDLYGERLVMLQPGISLLIDEIRGYLLTEHQEIGIKDVPHQYNTDVFNRCEESCAALLTLDGWKDIHSSLVTIPVDWEYTMPYGILYPRKPSNSVLHFVNAIQETEFSTLLTNFR